MKKLLPSILFFLVGLLVGVGTMAVVTFKGPQTVVKMQWGATARERVIYATLIQEQKYADLEKLVATNMAASFVGMKELGFNEELRQSAPMLKGFYEFSGKPIPDPLAPLLADVKGTDPRNLADYMASHADQVDWQPRK